MLYDFSVVKNTDGSHNIILNRKNDNIKVTFFLATKGLRTDALIRHMASLTDDQCAEFFIGTGDARPKKEKIPPKPKEPTWLNWSLETATPKTKDTCVEYVDGIGPITAWFIHSNTTYFAMKYKADGEQDIEGQFVLAAITDKQRTKFESGEWTSKMMVMQCKQLFLVKDWFAPDTLEVQPMRRLPKNWVW